jgi:squalene-hopene/tetraprenyl-beta-curcumene cyclase
MRTADSDRLSAPALETISTPTDPRSTLARADSHLRSLQHPDGYWKGLLETNVTMDAEDLMLREFLGLRGEEETAASARFIRSRQRADGTWANFYDGPGDLSTTIEAYVALRLAGDLPSAPHMERAASFVREAGGLEAARVFTHIWMALFGLWSWEEIPAIPPEVIFLPPSIPLNVYEFGCWARQTFVALSVVASYHPVRPLGFGIEELRSGTSPEPARRTLATWRGRFLILDELARRYDRLARRGILHRHVRERALARAEQWIVRRQESDGSWGGIQPPWVYSIIALHLRGYPLDHPVIARAFEGLDGFLVRDGSTRWLEACQSPIWDTALAVIALSDAGAAPDDPALVRSGRWLMAREVRTHGDWAVRRPGLEPGGWSFEFANANYPDVDDTAEVVLALRKVTPDDPKELECAVTRAIRWTEGMVSEQGAWGAFDADNVREVLYEIPFCDFGAVIDPPSADVTAHVVEMLAVEPTADRAKVDAGVAWLRSEQESDGSWFGRWGVNYVYGTGAALPALIAAGVDQNDPACRKAVHFLETHQNADGGWGEDVRSYDDPAWRGRGTSTASQTAWAIMALVAAGEAGSPAARAGVDFLCRTQRADGGWDEPYFTGTGFPGDFYLNYHLYRLVFPISAIGRFLRAVGEAP